MPILRPMDVEAGIGMEDLPIELVEEIAWHLPLATLRAFRLSNNRNAAAGCKPFLCFVPKAVTCSIFKSPCGPSSLQMSHLLRVAEFPSIANVITSLTLGRGASKLRLFAQLHLPSLASFRLNQLEITSARDITCFLSQHADTLVSFEIREVDIICPMTEGNRSETLPAEWRSLLSAIPELPHLAELVVLDLGYYNLDRDLRYKIWIDQEAIRQNEALRGSEGDRYPVLIRAKAAQATTKWAVPKVVDAVLQSTGKKVFKFQIPY